MEKTVFQYHQDLNGLEVLKAQYKQQNFARHSHEGYTIGLIENGAQRFFAVAQIMSRQQAVLS